MRRLLLAALLVISMINAWGQGSLLVCSSDGTKLATFLLDDQPRVFFRSGQVIVLSNNLDMSFEQSDVSYFSFEGVIADDIVSLMGDVDTPFRYDGENILFPANSKKLSVVVYTTDGKTIMEKEVGAGQSLALPLASLSSGVYLVKVNGVTCKILKR